MLMKVRLALYLNECLRTQPHENKRVVEAGQRVILEQKFIMKLMDLVYIFSRE